MNFKCFLYTKMAVLATCFSSCIVEPYPPSGVYHSNQYGAYAGYPQPVHASAPAHVPTPNPVAYLPPAQYSVPVQYRQPVQPFPQQLAVAPQRVRAHTMPSPTVPYASSAGNAGQQTTAFPPLDLNHKRIKASPYTIRGVHYRPMSPQQALWFSESGVCSLYDGSGQNSIGERVPHGMVTAAHKTLPLPCVIKVTNLKNGRTVYARVNDRGPFVAGRILDINYQGAAAIGLTKNQGLTPVKIEVISVGDGAKKIRR